MANTRGILDFDWDAPLSEDERDQMLAKIVSCVRKWRLEVPMVLFLESIAPLGHIAGQGLVAFSPFIAPALPSGIGGVQRLHKLLEDPNNVERLINILSEPDTPTKKQKEPNAARK